MQENFKELPDVVYWLRQILSVIIGIVCGVIPLEGSVGMARYGPTLFSCFEINSVSE